MVGHLESQMVSFLRRRGHIQVVDSVMEVYQLLVDDGHRLLSEDRVIAAPDSIDLTSLPSS